MEMYKSYWTIKGKNYMWTITHQKVWINLCLLELVINIPLKITKESWEEIRKREEELLKEFKKRLKKVVKSKKDA